MAKLISHLVTSPWLESALDIPSQAYSSLWARYKVWYKFCNVLTNEYHTSLHCTANHYEFTALVISNSQTYLSSQMMVKKWSDCFTNQATNAVKSMFIQLVKQININQKCYPGTNRSVRSNCQLLTGILSITLVNLANKIPHFCQ